MSIISTYFIKIHPGWITAISLFCMIACISEPENVSVDPLLNKGKKLIGIHCNPVDRDFELKNMKNLLERTFILIVNANVEKKRNLCDLLLEPYELRRFAALDFSKVDEIFSLGYSYALKQERMIKTLLGL